MYFALLSEFSLVPAFWTSCIVRSPATRPFHLAKITHIIFEFCVIGCSCCHKMRVSCCRYTTRHLLASTCSRSRSLTGVIQDMALVGKAQLMAVTVTSVAFNHWFVRPQTGVIICFSWVTDYCGRLLRPDVLAEPELIVFMWCYPICDSNWCDQIHLSDWFEFVHFERKQKFDLVSSCKQHWFSDGKHRVHFDTVQVTHFLTYSADSPTSSVAFKWSARSWNLSVYNLFRIFRITIIVYYIIASVHIVVALNGMECKNHFGCRDQFESKLLFRNQLHGTSFMRYCTTVMQSDAAAECTIRK